MTKYSILICAFSILGITAQAKDITIGHCMGQAPRTGEIVCDRADTEVSGAIFVPGGMLSTYAGDLLTAVRVNLASRRDMENFHVWLRSDLEGEDIVRGAVSAIKQGWNSVPLDQSWSVPQSSDGIYIGYTYRQTAPAYGATLDEHPCPGGYLLKIGDGQWQDLSAEGTLCIEASGEGENSPILDLQVTSLVAPQYYIATSHELTLSGTLKNVGSGDVSGYDLVCEIGGTDCGTVHLENPLLSRSYGEFTATFAPGEVPAGVSNLTVRIVNLSQGEDEDPQSNLMTVPVTVASRQYDKKVLVEEFTTERCANCPRVATYLEELAESPELKDQFITVCHHSGYYTDHLTTPWDQEYLWLFNMGGQSFAPAVFTDRYTPAESSAVISPMSKDDLRNPLTGRAGTPALVSVELTATSNESLPGEIHVTVQGEKSVDALCEHPHVTVMLVENGIPAIAQNGAAGEFIHNHVLRNVNSTWGEPIDFSGDRYRYECDLTVAPAWMTENMQIVAFIGNYDPTSPTLCEILNAGVISYSELTGLNSPEQYDRQDSEWYNLQGIRVQNPAPGVYLRRRGSRVEKIIVR